MDNTEFISQMATFSSLTQMEQIAENTSVTQEQQLAAATVNLLGKQVEGTSPDGQVVAGIVDRVELIDEQMVPFGRRRSSALRFHLQKSKVMASECSLIEFYNKY